MKKSGVIKIDNCVKEEHKEKNTSKETVWQQEKMYSQFARDMNVKTDTEEWELWMRSSKKIEMKAIISAAHEQT